MSKEIFKGEKPVEQTNDPESLEYELKSRSRPEQETKDNKIEIGELIGKAREKLKKVYKKQEADSEEIEERGKINAEEFFDEAKSKESDIELSLGGKTIESISNIKSSQEIRDNTAKEKVPEVIKALKEMGDSLENIKENVKVILDVGAGWGENLRDLAKELGAEKGIAIDKSTVLSESVKSDEEVGDKLTMVSGDAIEEMKHLENNSIDLSMAIALLQVVNRDEKIKILKEMRRVSELVVIVDELKRDGLGGFRDLFMNKLYNAGMGKYEVLKEGEWEKVFEEAGLVVVEEIFNKFGKNDFVIVLKKMEEKVEE